MDFKKDKMWNKVQGNWNQLKGEVKKEWGKFTEDDIDVIEGRHDILRGRLQELYSVDEAEAQRMVMKFTHRVYDQNTVGVPTAAR